MSCRLLSCPFCGIYILESIKDTSANTSVLHYCEGCKASFYHSHNFTFTKKEK